ncbi:hypothetical protein O181_031993 [Austropuccinia psidii MF-1]|uniref:Uncharacterized protein n=1 Tax=Austropuccinia psidii MF-1 TaxID=1389203 RepID=A0A9Q3H546_9BASI|nr:hypothetical protein [Austropuccinia psidii MF-1]
MNIVYKEGKSYTDSYGLSKWPLDNLKKRSAYDPEVATKVPIHFMETDRKRNFKFSEWAPGTCTSYTDFIRTEETETPIFGISSSEVQNNFF